METEIIDSDYIPKNGFMFHMGSIGEFSTMFCGLAQFERACMSARITEKDFNISTTGCDNNLNFFAEFLGENFLAYHVVATDEKHRREDGSIVYDICFDPSQIKKMVQKHKNRTMMWVYDADDTSTLRILLFPDGPRDIIWDFEMRLAIEPYVELRAPFTEPDHIIGFKTSVLRDVIKAFANLDYDNKWVCLEMDKDKMRFSMKKGLIANSSSIVIYHKKNHGLQDEESDDDEELMVRKQSIAPCDVVMNDDAVKQYFSITNFNRCLQCMSMDKKLCTVYVKKDFPVELVCTVGEIGVIKISILSFSEEEANEIELPF
jgi:hypothetical protein